jgi:hypothetical protein
MRTLRPLVGLATFALMALVSAGCGSDAPSKTATSSTSSPGASNSNGTASSPATTSSTGSGGDKMTTKRDQAVKFAACMRKNGVSDFPDPNAAGEFIYGVSVSPAVFTRAGAACKDLQPPGSLSVKRGPEQVKAGLAFAQCIRDNGVKDFPDPVKGEPLIDTTRIPSTDRSGGLAILNAAVATCRDLLDKAAAGQ